MFEVSVQVPAVAVQFDEREARVPEMARTVSFCKGIAPVPQAADVLAQFMVTEAAPAA